MRLEYRFALGIQVFRKLSAELFIELPQPAELFKPDSYLAYLHFIHPEKFTGVLDMYVSVPPSRPDGAFKYSRNLELFSVYGAVLICRNDHYRIPDIDIHPLCEEHGNNYLSLLYPFLSL